MTPDNGAAAPSLLTGFGRGVGWTYVSLILTGGSTFFLAAWSVRRIGTAQYGLFALVTSIAALLTVFDFALGLTVQRAGARVEPRGGGASSERQENLDAVHASHGAYTLFGLVGVLVTGLICAGLAVLGTAGRPYLLQTVVLVGLATSVQLGTAALPAVVLACGRFSLRSAATVAGVAVRVTIALVTVAHVGVAGLALAQLVGVLVERLVLARLVLARIRWFRLRPSVPDRPTLRRVTAYALPLLLINVSGQLFAVSDLVAVGALVGASAVGVYQVSSMVPLYLAGVLSLGYNVIFPALAGSDDGADQEQTSAFLTRLISYAGGLGLGVLALRRGDVVDLLLGSRNDLAEDVLLVLSAVSLTNLLVHGQASLLIARGRQSLMAWAVAIELPANLVLTVTFVVRYGAVGAAVGTLVTAALMDFVILPLVSKTEFGRPSLAITIRNGVMPAASALAVALLASRVGESAGQPAVRLVVAASVAAVLGLGVGALLLGADGRRTVRGALAIDVRDEVEASGPPEGATLSGTLPATHSGSTSA